MKKNIVLVCFHKKNTFNLPRIYKPILGGACNNTFECDCLKDNIAKNISNKNFMYSELTAFYWGYENLEYDTLGLVHYRRFFKGKDTATVNGKKIRILSDNEINKYLVAYDLIVPKKRHYFIESLYSHYCRTLRKEPMDALESIVARKFPEYFNEYSLLKKRRSAHMFNMFIANKEFIMKYFDFLFSVLCEIEKKVDSRKWNDYEKRYMGSVAELLLDVYIRKHKYKYKEIKVIECIPFATLKKGFKYLRTFITGRKYVGSDN